MTNQYCFQAWRTRNTMRVDALDRQRSTILVDGPPGAGKSAIIRAALLAGAPAIDLEQYPNEGRINGALIGLESFSGGAIPLFIGCANKGRELRLAFPGAMSAIVMPPENMYRSRRQARDKERPEKAHQGDYYHAFLRDLLANRQLYDYVGGTCPMPEMEVDQMLQAWMMFMEYTSVEAG